MTTHCEPDAAGHCITCSDEGLPMRVLGCGTLGVASCVDEDGRWSMVMTDLVDRVEPGDEILVHAGVALIRVGEPVPA